MFTIIITITITITITIVYHLLMSLLYLLLQHQHNAASRPITIPIISLKHIISYSTFYVMATPTRIREGAKLVKPILSLDKTEARRRVHNLYKLCYRHIPFISKHMCFLKPPYKTTVFSFCRGRRVILKSDLQHFPV